MPPLPALCSHGLLPPARAFCPCLPRLEASRAAPSEHPTPTVSALSIWALFWFKTQAISAERHWQSAAGLVAAPCGQSLGFGHSSVRAVPWPWQPRGQSLGLGRSSAGSPLALAALRAVPWPRIPRPRSWTRGLPDATASPVSPALARPPRVRQPLPTRMWEAGSHQMRRRGPALKQKRPGS